MPTIKNFVFCLSSNNIDGANNISGVLCAITPEYIPGLYSFGVNFAVLNLAEGAHNLDLRFKDEKGTIVASIDDALVNYEKDCSSNLPDEYIGVNVAANFQNVDMKHSGMYYLDVIFDGTCLDTYDIFVKGKNESV